MNSAQKILKAINEVPVPIGLTTRPTRWKLSSQDGVLVLECSPSRLSCFLRRACDVVVFGLRGRNAKELLACSQYMERVSEVAKMAMVELERHEEDAVEEDKVEPLKKKCESKDFRDEERTVLTALNAIPVPEKMLECSVGWRRGAEPSTCYFSSRFVKLVCSLESCKVNVRALYRHYLEDLEACAQYVREVQKVLKDLKERAKASEPSPERSDEDQVRRNVKLLECVQRCATFMQIGTVPVGVVVPGLAREPIRLYVDTLNGQVILMPGPIPILMGTVSSPWMCVLNPFIERYLLNCLEKSRDSLKPTKDKEEWGDSVEAKKAYSLYLECLEMLGESAPSPVKTKKLKERKQPTF